MNFLNKRPRPKLLVGVDSKDLRLSAFVDVLEIFLSTIVWLNILIC